MLRVEPARALDIQYKSRLLIDRINAYFGYRAVAEIRLIQMPMPQSEPLHAVMRPLPQQGATSIVPADAIDELGEALRSPRGQHPRQEEPGYNCGHRKAVTFKLLA